MKFALTFEGPLASNGSTRDKWDIRKQLDPQLRHLWETHPALIDVLHRRYVPKSGSFMVESHHSKEFPFPDPSQYGSEEYIDVCATKSVCDRTFRSVVSNALGLRCGLKIQYLRQEPPGNLIVAHGDIDNRLKTLFDALAIPDNQQVIDDKSIEDPIHCLLENDSLISSVSVETHRLLHQGNLAQTFAKLLIEVDVSVTVARFYNQPFVAD